MEHADICYYDSQDVFIITLNGKTMLEVYKKEKTPSTNALDFTEIFRQMAEETEYYLSEMEEEDYDITEEEFYQDYDDFY